MTPRQLVKLLELMNQGVREFHHGYCVGADFEAHRLVRTAYPEVKVIKHPPVIQVLVAHCPGGVEVPPKPYLARNKDIIDACDWLATDDTIKMFPLP
jgi:hypothetical protein